MMLRFMGLIVVALRDMPMGGSSRELIPERELIDGRRADAHARNEAAGAVLKALIFG